VVSYPSHYSVTLPLHYNRQEMIAKTALSVCRPGPDTTTIEQDVKKVRQSGLFMWSVSFNWFVWFVLFIWLNQTNRINQRDQMNQINQRDQTDQITR
jgi:hypothetical protein